MKLEEVSLDRYLGKHEDLEDFYAIYINCYNGLNSDLQRINYAADLANLRQNYEDQQYNIDSQIKSHQEILNQQIYEYAAVQPLTLDLDTVRLDPPNRNSFDSSLKGDTDYFVVTLDYFINMLIFGFSDAASMLGFQNKIYQRIKDEIEAKDNNPPNFSNLQEIIIHSIDHVALHRHWSTIAKILKEVA